MSNKEKPGRREAIAKMVDQMVKSGNSPEYAKKVAREAAIRKDRREQRK